MVTAAGAVMAGRDSFELCTEQYFRDYGGFFSAICFYPTNGVSPLVYRPEAW
jgi:hypothetical protein